MALSLTSTQITNPYLVCSQKLLTTPKYKGGIRVNYEYGTTISYRTGRNNIRADMLSRIRQNYHSDIAVFDIDDEDD